jgi:hypothetical protein
MVLIVHGVYHWATRVVAYRNDYCLRCDQPRVALQYRTFDAVHIFFVPVLPLGFLKRWRCQECGSDPHANVRTRRSIKWAGTVLLGFITFVGWAASPHSRPGEVWFIWTLRLGGLVACGLALRSSLRSPPDVNLADKLRSLKPSGDQSCMLCGAAMVSVETALKCSRCGILRREVAAA